MNCGLCGNPATGHLCEWDSRALAGRLARLPDLVAELAEHVVPRCAGLVEHTAHAAPGSRSPINLDVVDLHGRGDIAAAMEGWRADVQRERWPDRGAPPASGGVDHRVLAACRWLAMELDWVVAHYAQAGALAADVRRFEGAILAIVGEPPPRPKEIGQCIALVDDEGTVCGATLTHTAGQSAITCRGCRTVYRSQSDLLLLLHYQPATA